MMLNTWNSRRYFAADTAEEKGGAAEHSILNTVLMNSPFGGLSHLRQVYFIGIGGIGMSAIARFFHEQGVEVSGYDKTPTELTRALEAVGIAVHYEEDLSKIPTRPDLVVYTPAIPKDHREWLHYQQAKQKIVKRSDVLQMISNSSFNVCVAGTHGKTTISTMTAHILRHSEFGCNAFLGGISANYGTNYWSHPRNVCVIEADEFDRSFLKLSPDIAVISAMDADHLDIYGTAEDVEKAFIDFSHCIRTGGKLIARNGLKRASELPADKYLSYGVEEPDADITAQNLRLENGSYHFDLRLPGAEIKELRLNMGGRHNVENVVAAITVAWLMGLDVDKIRKAVDAFKGVKRRFEYVLKTDPVVVIDDYAHHPEELRALLDGARALFPDHHLVLCFQPHLYTRTRDFAEGFAEVMGQADELLLLPIYPARELPIEGVESELLIQRTRKMPAKVVSRDEMIAALEQIKSRCGEAGQKLLVVTAGAGDIDRLLEQIRKKMSEL